MACGVGRGACAAELMAEKGSEAFRMSDIVERSGVPFGSLYQYFPDKTAIIDTLAERYNAFVQADAAEESGRAGNVRKRPRLTARTPQHKRGSGSPSAGAGMR